MSKLNIYENSWTNLVFEDRNKEYGAYNLRQEHTKTSIFALLTGVLLLAVAASLPKIYNYLNPEHQITTLTPKLEPATIVNLDTYVPPPPASHEEAAIPQIKEPITQEPITSQQLINPEVVTSTAATPIDIATNNELKNLPNTGTTEATGSGVGTSNSTGTGTGTSSPGITESTIVSSALLDKLPEFPGGINKFYSYVGNNFEKPELDGDSAIRVNVAFVIEKDGSMTDIRVLKDPGYGLGKEAVRVLKSLKTKWTPGMIDGKAVRTAYNLPITIQPN
ncbi:energy transducer TonB [Flavobacterium gilvum]|uniref:TonB C-terminal domain-containing protein n=1 Tax=Flavobacterium gilvum TaxID=1492737 RepID=A0AAC9I1J0_9FLAO|nr:energy transducer TonB [Flavobacterium gilvum]AOW08045.1 hypothetical protein EM308_00140 [Flavobacterium gilvum]KFC57761.1 hypothetical protein FEM08_34760 [Flavobacterium gilvum]